ncbi:MAG TPA: hypothetical protein VFE91_02190, partial [Nitrososphaerales archaeon]|nr:hypothetical protein [Nitrososphaerales archaeon]
ETAYNALGLGFLYGTGYISQAYVSNPFGNVFPNLTLFAGVMANNPYLVLFLGVGVAAGFLLVAPQCMILMSRILFAYSFDRVAPKGLADVSDRFHTPIKSIVVAVVGGLIMLAFLSGALGSANSGTALALYFYAATATIALTFTFVSISAIIWPWRRKELYERSATVKRKVAGLPVVTWLGIVALAYCVGAVGWYAYDQISTGFYLGACTPGATVACDFIPFLELLLVIFIATIIFYFAVRWYRSKGGMPYDATFKEIPPE